MTTPILTLAEVQALAGFTEGPWRMSIENGGGVVAGHRHAIVSAYSSPLGWPCTQVEQASKPLLLAAPALHATCLHLHAEVARLTAELEKPALGPWVQTGAPNEWWQRRIVGADQAGADVHPAAGWWVKGIGRGRQEAAEGKRAADLAAIGRYRLVGGVFGEVSDAKT